MLADCQYSSYIYHPQGLLSTLNVMNIVWKWDQVLYGLIFDWLLCPEFPHLKIWPVQELGSVVNRRLVFVVFMQDFTLLAYCEILDKHGKVRRPTA